MSSVSGRAVSPSDVMLMKAVKTTTENASSASFPDEQRHKLPSVPLESSEILDSLASSTSQLDQLTIRDKSPEISTEANQPTQSNHAKEKAKVPHEETRVSLDLPRASSPLPWAMSTEWNRGVVGLINTHPPVQVSEKAVLLWDIFRRNPKKRIMAKDERIKQCLSERGFKLDFSNQGMAPLQEHLLKTEERITRGPGWYMFTPPNADYDYSVIPSLPKATTPIKRTHSRGRSLGEEFTAAKTSTTRKISTSPVSKKAKTNTPKTRNVSTSPARSVDLTNVFTEAQEYSYGTVPERKGSKEYFSLVQYFKRNRKKPLNNDLLIKHQQKNGLVVQVENFKNTINNLFNQLKGTDHELERPKRGVFKLP
jgi:hypothetical protein